MSMPAGLERVEIVANGHCARNLATSLAEDARRFLINRPALRTFVLGDDGIRADDGLFYRVDRDDGDGQATRIEFRADPGIFVTALDADEWIRRFPPAHRLRLELGRSVALVGHIAPTYLCLSGLGMFPGADSPPLPSVRHLHLLGSDLRCVHVRELTGNVDSARVFPNLATLAIGVRDVLIGPNDPMPSARHICLDASDLLATDLVVADAHRRASKIPDGRAHVVFGPCTLQSHDGCACRRPL